MSPPTTTIETSHTTYILLICILFFLFSRKSLFFTAYNFGHSSFLVSYLSMCTNISSYSFNKVAVGFLFEAELISLSGLIMPTVVDETVSAVVAGGCAEDTLVVTAAAADPVSLANEVDIVFLSSRRFWIRSKIDVDILSDRLIKLSIS